MTRATFNLSGRKPHWGGLPRRLSVTKTRYIFGGRDQDPLQYIEAYNILQIHSPNTFIIFSPLIGLDFAKYYKLPYDEDTQNIINESVIRINQTISPWNQERGVLWPWMATLIHNHRKTHWVHRYDLLHSDGCHLQEFHADEIGRLMASCLKKNVHNLFFS